MNRTTKTELESLTQQINDVTKTTPKNAFILSGAYGGWKLEQRIKGGGTKEITYGFCSKKELARQLRAFLAGVSAR